MRLIATSCGTYYHIESLEAPRYADFFDAVVAPEDLADVLTPEDCLWVPCRSPAQRLIPQKTVLEDHLKVGGTIVATGESRSDLWLPNVHFHGRPTNWWWWLDKEADLGVQISAPEHPLLRGMSRLDVTWHLHGHFDVPEGTEVLVEDEDGLPLFYEDKVSTPGRMLITSLDPMFHHGSHFMPATTRFLDLFLPNLKAYIDG